jgi:hypothetical protein
VGTGSITANPRNPLTAFVAFYCCCTVCCYDSSYNGCYDHRKGQDTANAHLLPSYVFVCALGMFYSSLFPIDVPVLLSGGDR